MRMSVSDLIGLADGVLEAGSFAAKTRRAYRWVWRSFERFCSLNGCLSPTREDGAVFLEGLGCPPAGGTGHDQFQRRAVSCLFDALETGSFRLIVGRRRIQVPECLAGVHRGYVASLSNRVLAAGTRRGKECSSRHFLAFLAGAGVTRVAELRAGHVFAYLASRAGLAVSTRSELLFFLREYLGFLVDRFGAEPGLADLFPVILVNKDAVLPSVFTPEEVRQALAAVNQAGHCARRDRAVVLLAVELGLRAGDIRDLRFDQIDWRLTRLSLVQAKTGQRVDLPLPDECLFALLDYWRNERPASPDPHVFVRSRAPFGPYARTTTFHQVIDACFRRAGVGVAGRHHGLHSLRHSAAVSMLTTGASLPVVAAVLGHASQETTRRYLRVDVEALRPLSLEVPDAR